MQAASVHLFSSVEKRQIWAYRIPSLLGGMLAAAACAWGASVFLGSRAAFLAGGVLGASFLLSSEAFIGKTDAVLCGATTLSMAALGRLYGASRGIGEARFACKLFLWLGLAIGMLDKGPITPMVVGLALIALAVADRDARWMARLGWIWGLVLVTVIVAPWAVAITVTTDGGFWTGAVNGGPGAQARRRARDARWTAGAARASSVSPDLPVHLPDSRRPGRWMAWPHQHGRQVRPGVARSSWIVFELLPTKLAHYTLPTFGAARVARRRRRDRSCAPRHRAAHRWIGAGLSLLIGVVFAILAILCQTRYGLATSWPWAVIVVLFALATGASGAIALYRRQLQAGLLASLALGVAMHMVLTGVLAPRLTALFSSNRAAKALARDHLDPRNGVTTGPPVLVGYGRAQSGFRPRHRHGAG